MNISASLAPEKMKRWQKRAWVVGIIAGLITVGRFTIPLFVDMMVAERDKELIELRATVLAQSTEIRHLEQLIAESLGATKLRFSQNEEHVGYIHDAVVAMRTELDIRFGQATSYSKNGLIGQQSRLRSKRWDDNAYRPMTKESRLKQLAKQSSKSLKKSDAFTPQGDPLAGIDIK